MNLQKKIEEIRQQPEPVRLRYVVICVAISMSAILILWVFSLRTSFRQIEEKPLEKSFESLTESVTPQEAPSLEEWIQQGSQTFSE
jgi:hypothetical protein